MSQGFRFWFGISYKNRQYFFFILNIWFFIKNSSRNFLPSNKQVIYTVWEIFIYT